MANSKHPTMRLPWQKRDRPPRGRKRKSEIIETTTELQPLQPTPSESEPAPAPISKVPTGLGAEPVNIVILGASFAGLSVAHHFLDETIDRLRITRVAPNYRLVIISPSTHVYWNIGAPRALVGPDLLKNKDIFIPIEPGFHRHRGHNFTIIQGEAVSLDPSARVVNVELIGSTAHMRVSQINKRSSKVLTPNAILSNKIQPIRYHALVMATGTYTHSDLLSLHGPHLNTMGALNQFHAQAAEARSIVVGGGGCSGVETAGQLATYLNYKSHWPLKKRIKLPKKIIVISGGDRVLPTFPQKVSLQAEKMLNRLGVEVKHGVRVIAVKEGFDLTGQTKIEFNDETTMIADMYVPCTGVIPNTDYLPAEMKTAKGFVAMNPKTMRVDHPLAGARTYSIGDVASYSQNWVIDVYAAIPTLMHNLLNDLLAHEYHLASPYGGNQEKIDDLKDRAFIQPPIDSQLCPITRFGGAGTILGHKVPTWFVHTSKGHDYKVGKAKTVVVNGGSPYIAKEGKAPKGTKK